MSERYEALHTTVAHALSVVIERALKPDPRVARHWESTTRLSWFGTAADHHLMHVSWSFGRFRDVPEVPGKRANVGVFSITRATFPEVDDVAIRAELDALVPAGTDGATRVFLHRVMLQLVTARALLALPERIGCEISFFARTDAVYADAATSRWPEHARERVATALAAMPAAIGHDCERLWASKENVLLEAVRTLPRG